MSKSPMEIPAGLDAEETLNFRLGFCTGFAKYVATHGGPGTGADAVAWHDEHDGPRREASLKSGIAAVKAYWKRRKIEPRELVAA